MTSGTRRSSSARPGRSDVRAARHARRSAARSVDCPAARQRLAELPRERTLRRLGIVVTALAFLSYFDFFNPNVRYVEYYHRHEFFHYYMGSKYSRELGYTRIYECTAIAEIELGRAEDVRRRELRDLHDSLIKPVSDELRAHRPRPVHEALHARALGEVQRRRRLVRGVLARQYWREMQKDHGYNPPPVWTMTGMLSRASAAPATASSSCSGARRAAQPRHGAAARLGLRLARHGGRHGVLGGLGADRVLLDGRRVPAPGLAVPAGGRGCLARKRRFGLAGAASTWSALLRVFPAILSSAGCSRSCSTSFEEALAASRAQAA